MTIPGPEKTILLVEDNPLDAELTRRALDRSGVLNRLVIARDGAEALAMLLPPPGAGPDPRLPHLPEVVLLDLKLPKVDGLDVLATLRAAEATRLLPVIVLTSSIEEADVVRSYHLGANSYVRKPVDFLEFIEAVRQLGLYWLIVNVQPPGGR